MKLHFITPHVKQGNPKYHHIQYYDIMNTTYIAQETDIVQDGSKSMAIFKLEKALQQQTDSYTNLLNERDDQINKVSIYS